MTFFLSKFDNKKLNSYFCNDLQFFKMKFFNFVSKRVVFLSAILVADNSSLVSAQNTYDDVYAIFQSKCTSCHNSSTLAGQLDMGASSSVVYSKIVNKNPVNTAALAKGDKLVSPGYPHWSFLM